MAERQLLPKIRYIILIGNIALSLIIFGYWCIVTTSYDLRLTKLTEIYANFSLWLLYFSLLPGPLYEAFPHLIGKALFIKARRAIGVSAFYFGLLHSLISFFGQLGSFKGLSFLSPLYLEAVILGIIALVILSLLALTSFDYWVKRLGRKWKLLHRLIYLAAWLIVIHTFMLGTHFADLSSLRVELFILALAFLLILEARRIDKALSRSFNLVPSFSIVFTIMVALIGLIGYSLLSPNRTTPGLGIHALHIQLAKQAQQSATATSIPGQIGDRTKRYSVSFNSPTAQINQPTELSFTVYDANSGNRVSLFNNIYEKPAHLIIVNQELTSFDHLHPTFSDGSFKLETSFSAHGIYHLYLDFQPVGAIEQQFAFTLNVGSATSVKATKQADQNLTKEFGNYEVTLSYPSLKAADLSIGKERLSFTLKDAKTKQPVTNLKPYLGTFGHLVMINEDNYEYLHIHPAVLTPLTPEASDGPSVEFIPLGLYGPIKPGIYRLFAEFNPANQLIVTDFTVEVK